MPCPKCHTETPPTARFCEICGTRLLPPCRCGAGPEAMDDAGYCSSCGLRWEQTPDRTPLVRDHIEIALSPRFAAVTDRGRKHPCNEDDVVIADEEIAGQSVAVLVVCDGVSSAQDSDQASATAVRRTQETVLEMLRADRKTDPGTALTAAIQTAHQAIYEQPYPAGSPKEPPGTTLVAALVQNGTATVAWVGDSRAYWFTNTEAALATHDHSWVNERIDAGEMTEEEALNSPQAHAITRCLGPLNGDAPGQPLEAPSVVSFALPPGSRLLLCTDGLWNYASQPTEIAALIGQLAEGAEAIEIARHLVQYALTQGGRDNIAVAVLENPAEQKEEHDAVSR